MEVIIKEFTPINMNIFDAANHCSLASLTAIFSYYHKIGYPQIESDSTILFETIRGMALSGHLYFPSSKGIIKGTLPFFIHHLARRVWKHYRYPEGTAITRFAFWNKAHFINTIKHEINSQRPLILSMSYGIYRRHSVTVYGFIENDEDEKNSFQLIVNDNWSEGKKLLDVDSFWDTYRMFIILCLIHPDKRI